MMDLPPQPLTGAAARWGDDRAIKTPFSLELFKD